ncbi:MAG: hypothetical protein GY832_33570 [Chloroflexi bacterium]|nr:hypothetical protein [Chloroflexota bacterium]
MGNGFERKGQSTDFEIDSLERELSFLAYTWRGLHSQEAEKAVEIVSKYHIVFAKLWDLGWDGEGLLPDSELPNDLMPSYYLEKWKIK